MPRSLLLLSSICLALIACGPSSNRDHACVGDQCNMGTCSPGESRACYTGAMGTQDVGLCKGGMQMCNSSGQWDNCQGEVVPTGEVCGNGQDEDCDGKTDEDTDNDGDGYTTCGGDCCDSVTECSNPAEVNPGAFDVPGDGIDNDCDGMVDNAALLCDQGLTSSSTNGIDYAHAMDICPSTMLTGDQLMNDPQKHWGIISAAFSLADGTGTPNPNAHAILGHYGTGVMPHGGVNLVLFSSGNAAGVGDPNYDSTLSADMGTTSAFPADFVAANGGSLPNAPGCPPPNGNSANDPVMLTLKLRVPTNAHSFSLDTNFFSDEFPEWTCSPYNDFFVVLLDSMYSGMPANPADKNLAFYQKMGTTAKVPVGVNLAYGNTGLFTQCVNGSVGCIGNPGMINTCTGVTELAGTGLDQPAPGECDTNSLMGGGTGWLTTSGNVQPGEIITLRIAVWDTSDSILDSLAVIDNFHWNADSSDPGTVIQRGIPPVGRFVPAAAATLQSTR